MAHDAHALHVSHLKGSVTWRSSVSPADDSWRLFIDDKGSPHLYLAAEAQTTEGETVTTYTCAVRAMLRADAEAGAAPPSLPRDFTISTYCTTEPDQHVAVCGHVHKTGATRREAVASLLAHLTVDDVAEQPVPSDGARFMVSVWKEEHAVNPYLARCGSALARVGKTPREAAHEAVDEFFRVPPQVTADPLADPAVAALAL